MITRDTAKMQKNTNDAEVRRKNAVILAHGYSGNAEKYKCRKGKVQNAKN